MARTEVGYGRSKEVDKKFREAIHLLIRFEKDFSTNYPVVTGKANKSDKSKSPLMTRILSTLKRNLHAEVRDSIYFFTP